MGKSAGAKSSIDGLPEATGGIAGDVAIGGVTVAVALEGDGAVLVAIGEVIAVGEGGFGKPVCVGAGPLGVGEALPQAASDIDNKKTATLNFNLLIKLFLSILSSFPICSSPLYQNMDKY